MIAIHRILCPIDFSTSSRRALDHAVAVARWYGATITSFHVHAPAPVAVYAPGPPLFPPGALTGGERQALLDSMKRLAATEAGATVPVGFEIGEGDAPANILDLAKTMPADLIVMGTHGRSGLERLVLGSVAEKVLRKAGCPVLTVPPGVADAVPGPAVLFKRILCAVDFSDCSTRALAYASSLAQEADARLAVLHVIDAAPEPPPGRDAPVLNRRRNLTALIDATKLDRLTRLNEAIPDGMRAYCTVETLVSTGTPHEEILRIAAEQKSELIVLGVHSRSAADLLYFGSTAQRVVREASCPVLTLRTG